MPKYLCMNCTNDKGTPGKPFAADVPKCPCGVDGTLPEYAAFIVPQAVLHYDPPHAILKGKGTNKAACDGKPVQGRYATGDPREVNCDQCKEKKVWKDGMTAAGEYFVTVDPVLNVAPNGTVEMAQNPE